MEYRDDSLHLDWTFNCDGPASITRALDSATWRTTEDGRWKDRLDAEHYRLGIEEGVRFIYSPGMIGGSANATVAENYFGYQSQYTVDRIGTPVVDSMQALWFSDVGETNLIDHVWPRMVWGGHFPESYLARVVAGRPVGTSTGFTENDTNPYLRMERPQDTNKFDLTVTLRADSLHKLVNATDTIAYVRVWRRVQLGQRAGAGAAAPCNCRIYDTVGTYVITKAKWNDTTDVLSSDTSAGSEAQQYRDITFTFYLPDSAKAYPQSDLVITSPDADTVLRANVPALKYVPAKAFRRHVSRSPDAVDWLDSAPYDSALGSPGNVWIHTELRRATDSAVLWRGDTISVRDMSADSLEELVEVPVDTVAAPGTPVFARLRAVATAGLEYELSGHFEWLSLDGGLAKLVRRGPAPAITRAAPLAIAVIPNPTSRQAMLRIASQRTGTLRVGIYDDRGRSLGLTEPTGIESGEYVLTIEVAALAPASYTVEAEVGAERATARLVVLR